MESKHQITETGTEARSGRGYRDHRATGGDIEVGADGEGRRHAAPRGQSLAGR